MENIQEETSQDDISYDNLPAPSNPNARQAEEDIYEDEFESDNEEQSPVITKKQNANPAGRVVQSSQPFREKPGDRTIEKLHRENTKLRGKFKEMSNRLNEYLLSRPPKRVPNAQANIDQQIKIAEGRIKQYETELKNYKKKVGRLNDVNLKVKLMQNISDYKQQILDFERENKVQHSKQVNKGLQLASERETGETEAVSSKYTDLLEQMKVIQNKVKKLESRMMSTADQLVAIESKRAAATAKKNELAPNVPKSSRKSSVDNSDTQPMQDYKQVEYDFRMKTNQLRTQNNKLSAIMKAKLKEVEKLSKTEALLDRSVSKVQHDLSSKNLELESIRTIREKNASAEAAMSGAGNSFITQNH